jgi:hypothetical protein
MIRMRQKDWDTLGLLLEYRALTSEQLARAKGVNADAITRRLGQLAEAHGPEALGLVTTQPLDMGDGPGRPRNLFSLTPQGLTKLRERGGLPEPSGGKWDLEARPASPRHLELLNWMWVWLRDLERRAPFLRVRVYSSASPFLPNVSGRRTILHERIRFPHEPTAVGLQPDGVFAIQHQELRKALLFFVEIDMGTEGLTSVAPAPGKITRKLQCYEQLFVNETYRRYESIFSATFRGFRMLLVSHDSAHLPALCRQVRSRADWNFVWLTSRGALVSQGAHAPIWYAGGRLDLPPESILGGEAARMTILPPHESRPTAAASPDAPPYHICE